MKTVGNILISGAMLATLIFAAPASAGSTAPPCDAWSYTFDTARRVVVETFDAVIAHDIDEVGRRAITRRVQRPVTRATWFEQESVFTIQLVFESSGCARVLKMTRATLDQLLGD